MRKTGVKGESKFVRGLITEATALAFPQDACTETFDCVFDKRGTVERRPAFALETGGANPSTVATTGEAIVEYAWTGVAGSGSKSFLVLQHGRYIRFYDTSTSVIPSADRETFTVDLNSYRPTAPTIDPADYPCSFARGDGKLFIANKGINPVYVAYDVGGNTITTTAITLRERDFLRAPETGWNINERYTGTIAGLIIADSNHWYNLLNQSWHTGFEGLAVSSAFAPARLWDSARADLPSNSETPWLYVGAAGGVPDTFDSSTIERRGPGTVLAPTGHFILDVFTPNRLAATAAYDAAYAPTAVTGDRTDDKERCQAIEFFTGRIFYAGTTSTDLSTKIFFSRIVEKVEHYGQCYQDNDPTTVSLVDLLPSDGGVIKIPDIDQVIKLFAFRTSLIVFATNGVWLIEGSSGQGFKANDYVVKKLSTLGTHSRLSFVDFKGTPIWWGEDGIMTIKYDANYNSFNVENLTYGTIWSFFQAIPKSNRQYVKGAHDSRNDVVYWVYRDAALTSSTHYHYDKVLVMNGFSGAFYPWILNVTSKNIRGISYVMSADGSGVPIIKYTTTTAIDATNENLTFSDVSSTTYLDWGVNDYSSYFITGYAVDGEAQRFFQGNYIWVYLDTETNSSCYLQGLYDFTNSSSSGKWSTVQQLYNSSLLYRVLNHRRLKIRGKGKALQLKFTSETGKPFFITGWSIWESQNAAP